MTLSELNHRKRELTVKLNYARDRHFEALCAADEEMDRMIKTQGELLNIEFLIQKARAETGMVESDKAWDLKRIREWTNSL